MRECRGESRVEGRAVSAVAALRDLVIRGLLPLDAARTELERLITQGVIFATLGCEATQRLI